MIYFEDESCRGRRVFRLFVDHIVLEFGGVPQNVCKVTCYFEVWVVFIGAKSLNSGLVFGEL